MTKDQEPRASTPSGPTREELEALSPEEFRNLLVNEYTRELADSIQTPQDVQWRAGFYVMAKSASDQRARAAERLLRTVSAAAVDYGYWMKAAYWKIDEACALLVGIEPNKDFKGEDLERLDGASPLATAYCRLKWLLLRDSNDHLQAKWEPSAILRWATSLEISIPDALREAVAVQRLGTKAHATPVEAGLDTRERNSLLRIIRALGVMAKLPERGAVASVERQLQELGFDGPGEATIRKVLQDARAPDADGKPQ